MTKSPAATGAPAPLSMRLPAEPPSLAVVRERLRRWLRTAALDSAAAADVLLAVGEAVSNAVEHATRDATHAVEVVVSAEATRSGVALTVADNGSWRTPRRRPGNRGHGRKLMSALVDAITITPSAQGTTVEMHKELAS